MPSSLRSAPLDPIPQIVQRGLLHYFNATCPSRHDIQFRVDAPDPDAHRAEGSGSGAQRCRLRILVPGLPAQHARFEVRHAKGNMCEVVGGLEGQPPRHVSVCLTPGAPEASLDKVGEGLLAQLKQRIGTLVLHRLSASGPPAARVLEALLDDDPSDDTREIR